MTSSYGYQRPLSNEEELYLQNQALRAELQRREDAKQGVREAIGGGLATGLGLGAVAAGAFGLASALSPAQRAKMGRNLSSTVDLTKEGAANLRRAAATRIAPQEAVPASRPAPKTSAERLQQIEETTRQARAERIPGVVVGDLPQPKTAIDPWTGRETITDPFGVPTVPSGPNIKERRFVFGDKTVRGKRETLIPEPTDEELAKVFAGSKERLYPSAPLTRKEAFDIAGQITESELPYVYKPQGEFVVETITDPNTGEIFTRGRSPERFKETYVKLQGTPGAFAEFSQRASALEKQARTIQSAAQGDFGPQSYLQSEGYVTTDNLVDQHQARSLGRIDQFANAANAAEDQQTGRVKMALQRNEDVNLAAIEMSEDTFDSQIAKAAQGDPTVASVTELDSAINQAASMLPDGLPLDQAERLPKDPWSGSATVPGPQRSIASSIETKLLPSAAVSPREKSQQFLQQRFEELGAVVPSPTRRERILSADPALAEAYELYASTGDPSVLSRLSEAPSSPINVTLREQSEFVSPEVATKSLYKPGVYPEYVGDLIEKDIELTNQISSLSQEKLNIAARQKELGEQELMLKNAMVQEPAGRDSYSRMLGKVKYEQQNLPSPESLNVDIGDAMAERDFTRVQLESAENLGPRYKLISREEGTRAFYEQTPEGQIIPETLEVRGGRPSVELELKRGGGRGSAEYDPSGQTGSKKGTYGIESTRYPQATSAQRPTQYTADELVQEALEQATASLEGDVPIPPPEQQVSRQFGPRASKQSLVASEIVRRAMIEGRDVKEALRKGGFGI